MQRHDSDASLETRGLLRAAQAGDTRAFRHLVETHMRPIYAIGYRMLGNHDDADDVAQETFVRAWEALDRYDPKYSVYTWLRTIATRLCLNELEKRKRRRTEGGEAFEVAAETQADPAADPAATAAGNETRRDIATALDELPADYRAVLVLRSFDDLSYEEIAATLDIPIGTVMSRLSRARARLRTALGNKMPLNEGEVK